MEGPDVPEDDIVSDVTRGRTVALVAFESE